MCKNAVKKILFVKIYISDQYRIQEICHKTILKWGNVKTLKCVPD